MPNKPRKQEKETQNPVARLLKSKAIFVLFLAAVVLLLSGLSKKMVQSRHMNDEISALETEIGSIERKNAELAELIDYLKSDAYVEREARDKLNMKKPGESAVVITHAGSEMAVEELEEQARGSSFKPNPVKWWEYLFT